jgi:hypothetical protein
MLVQVLAEVLLVLLLVHLLVQMFPVGKDSRSIENMCSRQGIYHQ